MGVHAKREFNCPVDATISLIGGKYKAVILWHLKGNTLRYSELHRRIPKATDKMLAQQLRELEQDGLIKRVVYPVVPPKIRILPHARKARRSYQCLMPCAIGARSTWINESREPTP